MIMRLTFLLAWLMSVAAAGEIIFPNDPRAFIDVKRDCGAIGDGVADDTQALQTAIERGSKNLFIYLPNGTYRISHTLVFRKSDKGNEGSMVGPWIFGQDRDKTIIKLADDAAGFGDPQKPLEAIRGLARPDGAKMNADFFDRTIVNLTIDTGKNAGAVGIKFYSNNTGLMQQVRVRGNGVCGIDLGFNDQNGPLLIQDVEIEGFVMGIRTAHILNAQTLSRVTIRAREVGLFHRGQVLAVEGLHVIDAPLAVDSGGNGVLTLVDCNLEAPAGGKGPAIKLEKGTLYAARLTTTGYSPAIATVGIEAGDAIGPNVAEYSSSPAKVLGDNVPSNGLQLKPEREPEIAMSSKPEDWVCANDFGAKIGDKEDDAPAFQKAIDEAARKGASTVYILPSKGGDPNWYIMKQDVRVHGSVRCITGIGLVRILGGDSGDPKYPENLAKFIVDDDPQASKTVLFQHLQVFSPRPSFGIEVKSSKRTVVCKATGGTVIARPNTTVFMTNCVGHCYQEAGSKVWMRQWNTERGPEKVQINTRNDGGQLWILLTRAQPKRLSKLIKEW
ncbi:MAG: glycosyl hydrolase family 28-related protein, partial [Planctomycetota bacterium]